MRLLKLKRIGEVSLAKDLIDDIPLHIPMAKVLPIMFAFCTPVSASARDNQ
jgi:hypothetical protein